MLGHPSFGRPQVGFEILNPPLAEFHIVPAEPGCELAAMPVGKLKHRVIEIDADHACLRADFLGENVTDLTRAASKVQDRFALGHKSRRVAAAVITIQDFLGDELEKLRVVSRGAAELCAWPQRPGRVPIENRSLMVDRAAVGRRILKGRDAPDRVGLHQSNPQREGSSKFRVARREWRRHMGIRPSIALAPNRRLSESVYRFRRPACNENGIAGRENQNECVNSRIKRSASR